MRGANRSLWMLFFVAGCAPAEDLGEEWSDDGDPSQQAFVTDALSRPPPTSGMYAYYPTYGSFGPGQSGFPGIGQSFVDPVFGSSIRRLTNELGLHSASEIYSRNGFFNANGTLVHHRAPSGHNIVNTT